MTISPGDPGPTDPTSGGTPVPPYEGRRRSAEIEPDDELKDEQPAEDASDPGREHPDEASAGPSHLSGVPRGETAGDS